MNVLEVNKLVKQRKQLGVQILMQIYPLFKPPELKNNAMTNATLELT